MNNNFVMITGASTGIGYELAHIFAKQNYNLILVARNEEKLLEVEKELEIKYSSRVEIFPIDLSKTESPDLLYSEIKKNGFTIEILVNNAGIGVNDRFSISPLEKQIEMIELNIVSLVKLTYLFLNDMLGNKSGKILNVASTAAFQPGPFMAGYYASKSFVLHFTEALGVELKNTNIIISALCPGPTITEFHKRANMVNSNLFRMPFSMDAKTVAEIAYTDFMKGKLIIIPGFLNKFLSFSVRFSPRSIVRNITGYLNKDDSR